MADPSYGAQPSDACADLDLWPSFDEMLAAYEEALDV